MGKWRFHGDDTWGLDSVYVVRENGMDHVRINEDANVQLGSGYDQTDFLQKLRYQTHRGVWDLNLQWQPDISSSRTSRSPGTSHGGRRGHQEEVVQSVGFQGLGGC